MRWYREHGYHFLVVTDHNYLTPVEGLNALFAAPGKFLVIAGDEVSDGAKDAAGRQVPVHLNALGLTRRLGAAGGEDVPGNLRNNVEAIREAGARVQINHPNFVWALTVADLAAVDHWRLFEIWNGHPAVNNLGGGDRPSTEALWDSLLTRGKQVFAVGADDTHALKHFGPEAANPGRAWVWVRCDSLAQDQLLAALEQGDFYSSTGVRLKDVRAGKAEYAVEVDSPANSNTRHTVYFIGRGGQVLAKSTANPAVYRLRVGIQGAVDHAGVPLAGVMNSGSGIQAVRPEDTRPPAAGHPSREGIKPISFNRLAQSSSRSRTNPPYQKGNRGLCSFPLLCHNTPSLADPGSGAHRLRELLRAMAAQQQGAAIVEDFS